MNPPDYNERIIAFIDILGWSDIISRLEVDPELHGSLHEILSTIGQLKQRESFVSVSGAVEVSVFSDSVVITVEEVGLVDLFFTLLFLQIEMLRLRVLLRGGVAKGKIIHNGDLLYGGGLIQAYALEKSAAIYPRILLDPKLVSTIDKELRDAFFVEDSDGCWFLDHFAIGLNVGSTDDEAGETHGSDETQADELLRWARIELDRIHEIHKRAKWMWFIKRLEKFRDESRNLEHAVRASRFIA